MAELSYADLAAAFAQDTTLGPIGEPDVGLPEGKFVRVPRAFVGHAAADGYKNRGSRPDATQLKHMMLVVATQFIALGADSDHSST